MKKFFLLMIMSLFIFPSFVNANHINNINIKVNVLKDGSAVIREVWDVNTYIGESMCTTIRPIGSLNVTDYLVYADGEILEYKKFERMHFMYGFGYSGSYVNDDGIVLCFGKNDMKRHTFNIEYEISDYIVNTDSGQVLYWPLIYNKTVDNFNIEISTYFDISDDLELWEFGVDADVSINNGKINISSIDKMKNDYVVLLAKFPDDTFSTGFSVIGYRNFDNIYLDAVNKGYESKYGSSVISGSVFFWVIVIGLIIIIPIRMIINKRRNVLNGYGYLNNKKIDIDNVPMYRDIPCNKDIYYAYILIRLNKFQHKEINILEAIILKWVKEKRINFNKIKKKNKEIKVIDLTMNPVFDNEFENKLYSMMYDASDNGILENCEFYKWAKNYDMRFLGLFAKMEVEIINNLKVDMHIYHRINKNDCKYRYVMDDKIYNDSVKLYGFKKYLEEFSSMDMKEVMELHLWDEYLIFASLFKMSDKISKQLKDVYPDMEELDMYDLM